MEEARATALPRLSGNKSTGFHSAAANVRSTGLLGGGGVNSSVMDGRELKVLIAVVVVVGGGWFGLPPRFTVHKLPPKREEKPQRRPKHHHPPRRPSIS